MFYFKSNSSSVYDHRRIGRGFMGDALLKETVHVVTPEDLILLKLMSLRPQDTVDIQNIILHQKNLDKAYLKSWAKKLKVTSSLKKFLSSI